MMVCDYSPLVDLVAVLKDMIPSRCRLYISRTARETEK